LIACTALSLLAIAATAFADARTDYLIRALRTSPMFRVRAQAAVSLGGVQTDPEVVQALSAALADEHPSVRAAAVGALERHNDPSAIPALRRAMNDSETAVRNAASRAVRQLERVARTQPRTRALPDASETSSPESGDTRFYVAVGRPGTKVRGISPEMLDSSRDFIARTADSVPGVEIAPENERPNAGARVITQRNLVGYYLDSSIVEVQEQPGALRVRVSIVLQDYPERNIRSMMTGTASLSGGGGDLARRQVIEGAFRGALRNLLQTLEAVSATHARGPGGRRR
jgi:hypothetical protein